MPHWSQSLKTFIIIKYKSKIMKPWIKKYQPTTPDEIQGQNKAVDTLKEYINNYKKRKGKAAILYGPTGCGKTISAYAVANELDLELLEVNASDFRNKAQIESIIGTASKQMSLFSKGKIILVDEIDGLSGTKDRGGISALTNLIKSSAFPIICTATDPYGKKLATLRKASNLIEFHTLSYVSIAKVLEKIAKAENVKTDNELLKTLARRVGGDMRAAINDMQILVDKNNELTKQSIDELSDREQKENIINALRLVLKTTDPNTAVHAFDNVPEDFDQRALWIDENLPSEYEKPEDLARAYDFISKADIMNRRIRRWQHWRFLVYINAYLTAGIAVSKDEKYKKFVPYRPTTRILKIWKANMKYQKRKAIAEKIAAKSHCSTKTVIQDMLPYIQVAMKKDQQLSSNLGEEFELSKEEIDWLRK